MPIIYSVTQENFIEDMDFFTNNKLAVWTKDLQDAVDMCNACDPALLLNEPLGSVPIDDPGVFKGAKNSLINVYKDSFGNIPLDSYTPNVIGYAALSIFIENVQELFDDYSNPFDSLYNSSDTTYYDTIYKALKLLKNFDTTILIEVEWVADNIPDDNKSPGGAFAEQHITDTPYYTDILNDYDYMYYLQLIGSSSLQSDEVDPPKNYLDKKYVKKVKYLDFYAGKLK